MTSLYFLFAMAVAPTTSFAENLCSETLQRQAPAIAQNVSFKPGGGADATLAKRWQLVWSDEFNNDGKPDPKKWKYETGGWGWFNSELQNYTSRQENAYVKNGNLVIEARHEDYSDGQDKNQFTSAKLNSLASWTYGRLEIRARVPIVRGAWPAGWLFPEKQTYGDSFWPDNGEIDVLESVGHIPGINVASAHSKAYNFKAEVMRNKSKEVADLNTKFHTYAVEWLPTHLDFYIDDDRYFSVYKEAADTWKQWPFDQDFHLKLNMAVGGDWAGEAGIDERAFPAKLEIDYIRVYRPTNPEDCNDGRLPAGKFNKVIRAIGHPEKNAAALVKGHGK